jgi:drug/metabolite transporter (DMT)-like permease
MPSRGVVYMAASALGFSVMSVLVKLASARVPVGEIVLARAIVTLAISYAMVRRAGIDPLGHARGRLVSRGVLGFFALACYYVGLSRLPLADATTLQNTIPLITTLLAWWLLKEGIGRATVLALVSGLAGVLLIARPGGGGHDVLGIAIVLIGACLSSLAYVTVRQLSRTDHALVIVLYFPLVATPLAIPWAATSFAVPQPLDILLLVAIGVATQVGQVFLTMGLAALRAGPATAVSYLQVCFAMIWQLVIWGDAPALTTVAGAALILAGTLVVSASTRAGTS